MENSQHLTDLLPEYLAERISFRISEVTRLLAISRSSVYRAIDRGELRVTKLHGATLILRQDFLDFIAALSAKGKVSGKHPAGTL